VSKETLNHPGLVNLVSGLDVFCHTSEAYCRAYSALGIDIINRVPNCNAPAPTEPGQIRSHSARPYQYAHLGIYDTVMRHTYPCNTPEEVWDLDMDTVHYEDLLTPVPHPLTAGDVRCRQEIIGDQGLYYPMLYTTLFMWGVEVLGFEIFMLAATLEPARFHAHFLLPCVEKSKAVIREILQAADSPFLFFHDDLAGRTGPLFQPSWYDTYIFPHYEEIFAEAKQAGRKVIFVADGNMTVFLPRLLDVGVDGLMFENPATPLEQVIDHFGDPERFMIGGIDTVSLTTGRPEDVRHMVYDLMGKVDGIQGFALASCGGLHGNIPLANLEAYFDARSDVGATPKDWRTRCRV
jgi:hypothetical protein